MALKEEIIELLESTERIGMNNLIGHMELNGFFEAPSSGAYHLCEEGGLAKHSMNVYEVAKKVKDAIGADVSDQSIIICSILHDLGKMGDHGKQNYVPNMVRAKTKNKETGEYDMVQSSAKPYETNKDLLYIDHEIRSVAIAERFIDLTEEEEFAILYHNGMYGQLKYSYSGKETPLSMIVHFADMWASRAMEAEQEES